MSALPEEHDVSLPELIEQLPPDMRREARDFVEFLLARRKRAESGEPSFGWAGALAELKDQYTAVELQHASLDWCEHEPTAE